MPNDSDKPIFSFVIPALNEERSLPRTIASIRQHMHGLRHEIIVIDNGSSDNTALISRKLDALVFIQPDMSIAALRNYGAKQASGDFLVFIDADVTLTESWQKKLPSICQSLTENRKLIVGSHCSPPDDGDWLSRNWFYYRYTTRAGEAVHVGSGHMIMNLAFFEVLGGFEDSLETGEDYELCQRARKAGATILNDPQLKVIHHDFPKNLRSFVKRETWHGLGDVGSWESFINSKVAIAAFIFLVLHVVMLIGLLVPVLAHLKWSALLLLLCLLGASCIKQYQHAPLKVQLINTLLFYFYYLGRTLSFQYSWRTWRRRRLA